MNTRITPIMFLEHYCRQRNLALAELEVAHTLVATWSGSLAEYLAGETGAQRCEHWPYWHRQLGLWRFQIGRARFSVARLPVGAPATVAQLEELIALGARRIIGIGLAGSLQETAPIGSILLPGSCIREEGTSAHYLPPDIEVGPDPGLEQALAGALAGAGLPVHRGRHWTTDAPYRELVWKIERYRRQGVLGVDMETSAVYALGRFHGLAAANLLVVSDELWQQWNPALGTARLQKAMQQAAMAVLELLPGLGRWEAAGSEPGEELPT